MLEEVLSLLGVPVTGCRYACRLQKPTCGARKVPWVPKLQLEIWWRFAQALVPGQQLRSPDAGDFG